ncbi:unnamed protein product [Closterium sp. Naga37s-1]|nr:unnamed protein product [Closterium sp. Naga37s-1]
MEERAAAVHVEVSPIAVKIALQITERVARDGGAALIVDYGEDRMISDSLQAIRKHEFVNVLDAPGSADLSAHAIRKHEFVNVLDAPGTADLSAYVDFAALRQTVIDSKFPARAYGPITQSQLLGRLGINFRVEATPSSPPYAPSLPPFPHPPSPVSTLTVPARAYGPISQSQLLGRLGINFRVEALLRVASEQQAEALRDG